MNDAAHVARKVPANLLSIPARTKPARCVAKHSVTVLQSGRSWHPSPRDSEVQKLIGSRLVIPHGDRRELAQSRRVVDEYQLIAENNDHVVCELILHHHIGQDSG